MSPPSRLRLATRAPGRRLPIRACSQSRPSSSFRDRSSAAPAAHCSVRYGGRGYALLGATVGATLAFLSARYLASDWVAGEGREPAGAARPGGRGGGLALRRLCPPGTALPFNLVNYALGLTRIRLLDYSLALLVCMAPGTFAYTYLGYAGREAVVGGEGPVQKGLMALGLVALAAFLPMVVRRFRSHSFTWLDAVQLRERTGWQSFS
jgi:SNARE associated Golgi protein